MLDQSRLKKLLIYDPETGVFLRNGVAATNKMFMAKAGSVQKNGYVRICVDGWYYYAHRLAFLYMTGEWPVSNVDHVDRNRANNAWDNLRTATFPQNATNSDRHNKHGLRGVAFRKDRANKPWSAGITVNKRRRHLGYFATAEEAHAAYVAAQREEHGDFAQ